MNWVSHQCAACLSVRSLSCSALWCSSAASAWSTNTPWGIWQAGKPTPLTWSIWRGGLSPSSATWNLVGAEWMCSVLCEMSEGKLWGGRVHKTSIFTPLFRECPPHVPVSPQPRPQGSVWPLHSISAQSQHLRPGHSKWAAVWDVWVSDSCLFVSTDLKVACCAKPLRTPYGFFFHFHICDGGTANHIQQAFLWTAVHVERK